MPLVFADRVVENTTITGTGDITLLGPVANYQSFSATIGIGNTCYYSLIDSTNSDWEVGLGTLTGSTTLQRTSVLDSSNAGALVNFGVGTKVVFCDTPAALFPSSPALDKAKWGTD